jgi:hypothetical protein
MDTAGAATNRMNAQSHHPRNAVRQKSFLRGTINFNNACSTFDCLIRDISPKGARLDFSGTVSTPDVIDLYIPQKEQTLYAKVMWRRGEEVGIKFSHPSAMDELAEADKLTRRVIMMETEIVAIKRACRKLRAAAA